LINLVLGAVLILTGVQFFIDFNTDIAKATRALVGWIGNNNLNDVISVTISSIEILIGLFFVSRIFGLNKKLSVVMFWFSFIAWFAILVYQSFFAIQPMTPTLFSWIQAFAFNVLILANIWLSKE
jgi:hypothetical protein